MSLAIDVENVVEVLSAGSWQPVADFKLETIRWIDGVDHHGAMWTESGATVALAARAGIRQNPSVSLELAEGVFFPRLAHFRQLGWTEGGGGTLGGTFSQ